MIFSSVIVYGYINKISRAPISSYASINGVSISTVRTISGVTTVDSNASATLITSTELLNWANMNASEVTTVINYMLAQNMTEVTLRWDVLATGDWTDGSANGAWVTLAEAYIIQFNAAGIDVNIDLHSWYTTWDTYWDDDVAGTDELAYRATYIDFVEDVTTELNDTNIKAWMVLNEPQFQTASAAENQFIVDIVVAAKDITIKPVSVRFMGGASPWDGGTPHYSSAIADEIDFYSINTYWDADDPTTPVYGCSQQDILDTIAAAEADGKEVWITEFGKTNANETTQATFIANWVTWGETNNCTRVFCWASQPESGGGETYNIWNAYIPRPAWYELVNP